MLRKRFKPNDCIVYRAIKHSTSPGHRAEQIAPAPLGETYTYRVDKYWVVDEVEEDNWLVLRTRRGKRRRIRVEDPNLRRPTLWERITLAHRFPTPLADQQPHCAGNVGSR